MKNKRVKQMIYSGYCALSSKYVNSYNPVKYDWAFDRLRLFEMSMKRQQLRHSHLSTVSLTAQQLRKLK